jgi:hypothetical protein
MRVIEQKMLDAIRARKSVSMGNTTVTCTKAGGWDVRLHGHLIAVSNDEGGMNFSLAGWPTRTTRSRINALLREFVPGAMLYQGNYAQCFEHGGKVRPLGADAWVEVRVP